MNKIFVSTRMRLVRVNHTLLRRFNTQLPKPNSASSGSSTTKPSIPDIKPIKPGATSSNFVWNLFWVLVVGAGAAEGITYFVLNDETGNYKKYDKVIRDNVPGVIVDVLKKDGYLNNFIAHTRSLLYPVAAVPAKPAVVAKSPEIVTEKEDKVNAPAAVLIGLLEEGKNLEDWLRIKDEIIVLEPRLLPIIDQETSVRRAELAKSALPAKISDDIQEQLNAGKEKHKKKNVDGEKAKDPETVEKVIIKKNINSEADLIEDEIQLLKKKLNALKSSDLDETFPTTAKGSTAYEIESKISSDLESVLVNDLKLISEEELKRRLIKLILEFKDRSRWEAVRLSNVIEIESKKMKEKSHDLLQRQQELYEELMSAETQKAAAQARLLLKDQLEKEFAATIAKQESEMKTSMQSALNEQKEDLINKFNKQFSEAKNKFELARTELIQKFETELQRAKQATDFALKEKQAIQHVYEFSNLAHAVSVSFLDMSDKVVNHLPFKQEIDALKSVAQSDPVLITTLNSIPSSVVVNGLAELPTMQQAFQQVYGDLKKHVLISKEQPTLMNHVLASVITRLTFDSSEANSGLGSEESILSEARDAIIENGDLEQGIQLLEKLSLKNRKLAEPFIAMVKDQKSAQQSLRFVEMHIKKMAKEAAQSS